MNNQEAHARLKSILQELPTGVVARATNAEWFNKANAMIERLKHPNDGAALLHANALFSGGMSAKAIQAMSDLVMKNIARLDLDLPLEAQGAFIGVGNAMDALASVTQILQQATASVRIIDPYMDEATPRKFAIMAAENISIELLADAANVKPNLAPTLGPWRQQYGALRPIEARLTAARTLHDRLIIIDGATVYSVTQSLKDIAARSPASIIKVDGETAALKIPAYDAMWATANVIP